MDVVKSAIKKEILSHNSKHWVYTNIINIALLMKDQIIYFPTFLDFRGRIYPTPNYFSYQSNDLARSLLLFKDINTNINKSDNNFYNIFNYILNQDILSKNSDIQSYNENKVKDIKVKDLDYFKFYVANTYGKDKLTRKGKLRWFNNNIDAILNTYKNNLDFFKNKYLFESKEPFQFLSCIINYYNYINYNSEIKVPILFDASCSGIQHLSALTTDIKIASLVNLLDNEEPSDFYEYCLNQLIEVIKSIPDDGYNKVLKDKLLQIKINRKWLKHCIMTIPYNVTPMGLSDKLMKLFDIKELDIKLYEKLESGKINLHKINEDFKDMDLTNISSLDLPEDLKIDIDIQSNLENLEKSENSDKSKKVKSSKSRTTKTILIPNKEILNENSNENLYFTNSELLSFANLIKITVLNIIPPFNNLKIYFDKIIEIMKKIDMPIS